MFTGIIENLGEIVGRKVLGKNSFTLLVKPRSLFKKIKIGESIAINGCCLTVTSYKKNILSFDVSDETLRKTALGQYQKGGVVNLERAMQVGDRFGGHFVLGHVDCVGTVSAVKKNPGSISYAIKYPKKFSKLLIEKGSITVDGISLTVCDLTATSFSLYIIPHTLKETHLGQVKKGSKVNLEFDVLGKYVQRR